MADLYQDITITVNLSELTPETYKQMYKVLEEISWGKPETVTYPFPLSPEHKELLEKIK